VAAETGQNYFSIIFSAASRKNDAKTQNMTRVECYAGYAYPERPLAFWWEGRRLEIVEIRSEGRTPQGKHFLVETTGERVFEMNYDQADGEWQVVEVS
jgi:hypothetical protein